MFTTCPAGCQDTLGHGVEGQLACWVSAWDLRSATETGGRTDYTAGCRLRGAVKEHLLATRVTVSGQVLWRTSAAAADRPKSLRPRASECGSGRLEKGPV